MDIFQARAMFNKKLSRSWGHHIARGWAFVLLDRLRDYVVPTSPFANRSTYSDHYGSSSVEANGQFCHFHGHGRDNNQGGYVVRSGFSLSP